MLEPITLLFCTGQLQCNFAEELVDRLATHLGEGQGWTVTAPLFEEQGNAAR